MIMMDPSLVQYDWCLSEKETPGIGIHRRERIQGPGRGQPSTSHTEKPQEKEDLLQTLI